MKFVGCIRVCALLSSMLAIPGAFAASSAELDQAMAHDGLKRVTIKGTDLAYTRPGATLAGYKRVKLDPIEVAFSKSWDPKKPGSNFKLSNTERENIRSGVAKLVYDQFVRELQSKNAYPVVTEAGPDVLRVRANIVNLYINSPDTQSAGVRTFTVSAGEMTIFLELFDSETGQVLARMVDRSEARSNGMMNLSGSVENARQAEIIASAWARSLRNGLDKAHGAGK